MDVRSAASSSRASPSIAARAAMLATATVLAAPALLVLGSVLKATTHHRALGGTTFALVALGVSAVALALGARASAVVGRWAGAATGRARVVTFASAALVATVLCALVVVAARGPSAPSHPAGEASDGSP